MQEQKKLKIDVFLPYFSQYNVLQYFSHKFVEALERKGISCRLLEGKDIFLLPKKSPPDFTLGFNGAIVLEDYSLFCDQIKIPHIACLVDPSYSFFKLAKSPYIIFTCDDLFSSNFLHHIGCQRSFFMPHAVEKELSPIPDEKRIYDIVMPATYIDCENRRKNWPKLFSKKNYQCMEEVIEMALTQPEKSFIVAIQEVFNWSDDLSNLVPAFQEIELYLKGRDRLDLLESIKDHPIHIFGNSSDIHGWTKYSKSHSNIIFHPCKSYMEIMHIMKQSKIVLNSSLKNQHGAHERVFSAAACEAVVVTNDNPYIRQTFTDGKDIILYQRQNFAKVNDTINQLLKDETARQTMAAAGRQIVMDHHTWDHRAEQLLKDISSLKTP